MGNLIQKDIERKELYEKQGLQNLTGNVFLDKPWVKHYLSVPHKVIPLEQTLNELLEAEAENLTQGLPGMSAARPGRATAAAIKPEPHHHIRGCNAQCSPPEGDPLRLPSSSGIAAGRAAWRRRSSRCIWPVCRSGGIMENISATMLDNVIDQEEAVPAEPEGNDPPAVAAMAPVPTEKPTPQPKPAPAEIDLSAITVGTAVRHKAFGKGTVTALESDRITVSLDVGEKTFLLPAAVLQGFLNLDD